MPDKMQRFTQRARHALALAQETAERMQHRAIETGHLLLGLLLEDGGVGSRTLKDLGMDRASLEQAVRKLYDGEKRPPFAKLDLAPGVKNVLERSVAESRNMGHTYIGTEHLLIALTAQPDPATQRLLAETGLDGERVRARVMEILSAQPSRGDYPDLSAQRVDVEATAHRLAEQLVREMRPDQREILFELQERMNDLLNEWHQAGEMRLTDEQWRSAMARALGEMLNVRRDGGT